MKSYGVIFLCVLWCGVRSAKVQLPEGFRLCRRSDPNLDKCFVDAANADYTHLKDGYAPLGLQPVYPLKAAPLTLALGNEKAGISFRLELSECSLTHTLDKITRAHIDFDKHMFEVDGIFKNFTLSGNHITTGRFLIGNIKGQGKFTAVMHNLLARIHAEASMKERDGEMYWHFDKLTLKVTPKKVSCRLENVVPNKDVNDAINQAMNSNWELVFPPHYPTIENAVAPVIQDYINSVLDKIPHDQLFAP